MRRPSKKVLRLFVEAEQIAELLLELKTEEQRLRATPEKLWRGRAVAMSMLAARARAASDVEAKEARAPRRKETRR